MKNRQPANANPKILAFIQGITIQRIVIFIPQFKTDWINQIKQFPEVKFDVQNKSWLIPYSTTTVQILENTFGQNILFAFKVGQTLGHHKTDL